MIVRLTHAQWNAVRSRITPDLVEVMKELRTTAPGAHDYRLPAIGWSRVLEQLVAVAYGPLGGKKAGSSATLYRAIQRIADLVGEIESHPAFKAGQGVLGPSGDVLPGWELNGQRVPYPPGPGDERPWRFVAFTPRLHSKHGLEITYWAISEPHPGDVLHEESLHLRLNRA